MEQIHLYYHFVNEPKWSRNGKTIFLHDLFVNNPTYRYCSKIRWIMMEKVSLVFFIHDLVWRENFNLVLANYGIFIRIRPKLVFYYHISINFTPKKGYFYLEWFKICQDWQCLIKFCFMRQGAKISRFFNNIFLSTNIKTMPSIILKSFVGKEYSIICDSASEISRFAVSIQVSCSAFSVSDKRYPHLTTVGPPHWMILPRLVHCLNSWLLGSDKSTISVDMLTLNFISGWFFWRWLLRDLQWTSGVGWSACSWWVCVPFGPTIAWW